MSSADPPIPAHFPETRWSRILRQREDTLERRRALEDIYSSRWRALYVYARRRGLAVAEAEDAVQGLLTRLLEQDFLARLDPERGRLRSYLLRAFDHYLQNQKQERRALKRGAGAIPKSLESLEVDLASSSQDPARAYDREWALDVFERALRELESELGAGERQGPAEVIRELFRFGEVEPYEQLAARHGMSVSQLKSFVHRSKRRFRALLLRELSDTVSSADDTERELNDLLACLNSES
ncbi:MAG: RNA polymerase sigma factor [Myxococcota bacterium]